MSKRSWNNGTKELELIAENLWSEIGKAEQGEKVGRDGRATGPGSKEIEGVEVGSMVVTTYGETVMIDEIDTNSDKFGRTIYIGTSKDGEERDRVLTPDQIDRVSP